MTWRTHMMGGILFGEVAGLLLNQPSPELGLLTLTSSVAALAPDLDQPNSKASRYGLNRLVAYPLNKLFGHRGFIHSPLLYLGLTGTLILLRVVPMWFWLGFFLGAISHLVLDTLNPSGIRWLWPGKHAYSLAKIKTGSTGENIFAIGLLVLIAVTTFLVFGSDTTLLSFTA